MALVDTWRETFNQTIQHPSHALPLQKASQQGKKAWTMHMTAAVVAACQALGWEVAAQGFSCQALPVSRSEYLNIDVTAFLPGEHKWTFPLAVFELENQQDDDYVAYNLWKLLCVRAALRVLYCYRPAGDDARSLKKVLTEEVIGSMSLHDRLQLPGSTLVVVGTYSTQDMFPYGYFKWWKLDKNTGKFLTM